MPIEGEIAAGLAVHEATTTGIHGVGAGDIVGTTLTQTLTNKTLEAEVLAALLKGVNILHIPTNAGWTGVVTGSGAVTDFGPFHQDPITGATASSSALFHCPIYVWGKVGSVQNLFPFDKKFHLIFNYARAGSVATAIARLQIKQVSTEGALAAPGIGLRVENLALYGESYGTELGSVDLSTILTSNVGVQIVILHDPSVPKIEWYVNGVLKGTQSTAAKIPTGDSAIPCSLVHSVINGATATSVYSLMGQPKIWQAR